MNNTASIVRNKQGRVVGRIEDRIFIKEAYGHKHMLRQPVAWSIDCDIFDRVIKPLCSAIHILDRDTGHKHVCGVDTFRLNCKKIDRRYNTQYYLELIHWRVS